MPADLKPEDVLKSLKKGRVEPFYLFYGPEEFRLEKTLDTVRNTLVPESFRDLNVEIFYADRKTSCGEIVHHARSLPFLASLRVVIVRRVENFSPGQLEEFLPYLDNPSETTCLIFISSKTDFKKRFYKSIRDLGRSVYFSDLSEREVGRWIHQTARELGLDMDRAACEYLQQIVGSRLRDLSIELEKMYLRYGEANVGVEEVRELTTHSRTYSIFELMDAVSLKDSAGSLTVVNRFLEEASEKDAALRLMGMLNRQMRLLWQTKEILSGGGRESELSRALGIPPFSAKGFAQHSRHWTPGELRKALRLLYDADGLLKAGSRPKPVLENLILCICSGESAYEDEAI
jgi:DNA polymerase-3 subunit delta